ncbi:MAG: ABC transporter permease [Faecousia sp.]
MIENIRLAFQGIWGHKLRSMLTMLGIIIGIAAIITIVSTIKGTNEQIKENLIGAGNNVVTVQLNQGGYVYDMSWNGIPQGVRVITEETRQELEAIDGVEKVSLYYARTYAEGVYYLNTMFNGGAVYGIDEQYLNVYGLQVKSGRGFVESDFRDFRKVALVDANAVTTLFGGESPVGKAIELQGDVFTVVGVVALSDEFAPTINSINDYWMYMNQSAGSIYLPDTVWPTVYRFDEPQNVAIKVENTDVMASTGKSAADLLTQKQIIGTDSNFDYRSQDMLEQAQQLQKMSESTNTQLIWIAGISLLVGGIGVMNIMLVSVTERTAEIGLKKAIGAKKKRILLQFLTEAAVLTSMGGIIGVISGIGLAQLISAMMQIPVAIDVSAIVVSVVFSTLIGVVFGLLPATQAANLNPIQALRRD